MTSPRGVYVKPDVRREDLFQRFEVFETAKKIKKINHFFLVEVLPLFHPAARTINTNVYIFSERITKWSGYA